MANYKRNQNNLQNYQYLLRIKNKKNLKNKILEILLKIFAIIFSIIFIIIMFYISKPFRNYTNYRNKLNKKPFANLTNFPFMINVFNSNDEIFKESERIFTISAKFHSMTPILNETGEYVSFNETKKQMNFGKCSEMNYLNFTDLDFFQSEKYFYLCLDTRNLTIEGYKKNKYFYNTYATIEIDKCVNTTENNNHCYSKEKINKELFFSFLRFFFIGFDYENSSSVIPDIPYFDFIRESLESVSLKMIDFKVKDNKFKVTEGILRNYREAKVISMRKENVDKYFIRDYENISTIFSLEISIDNLMGFYDIRN